jgi:hypothetical protein
MGCAPGRKNVPDTMGQYMGYWTGPGGCCLRFAGCFWSLCCCMPSWNGTIRVLTAEASELPLTMASSAAYALSPIALQQTGFLTSSNRTLYALPHLPVTQEEVSSGGSCWEIWLRFCAPGTGHGLFLMGTDKGCCKQANFAEAGNERSLSANKAWTLANLPISR